VLTIATIMSTSNIACILPLRSLSKVIQYERLVLILDIWF
jgi:hypothetical protein